MSKYISASTRNIGSSGMGNNVTIKGVDIPFWDLVMLFMKSIFAIVVAWIGIVLIIALPIVFLVSLGSDEWSSLLQ